MCDKIVTRFFPLCSKIKFVLKYGLQQINKNTLSKTVFRSFFFLVENDINNSSNFHVNIRVCTPNKPNSVSVLFHWLHLDRNKVFLTSKQLKLPEFFVALQYRIIFGMVMSGIETCTSKTQNSFDYRAWTILYHVVAIMHAYLYVYRSSVFSLRRDLLFDRLLTTITVVVVTDNNELRLYLYSVCPK